MDFRALLRKYIDYIGAVEGVDYIKDLEYRDMAPVPFTDEEWAELERLSDEGRAAERGTGKRQRP